MIYNSSLVYVVKYKNEKVGLLYIRERFVFSQQPICMTSDWREARDKDKCCDKAGGDVPPCRVLCSSPEEKSAPTSFPCVKRRSVLKRFY